MMRITTVLAVTSGAVFLTSCGGGGGGGSGNNSPPAANVPTVSISVVPSGIALGQQAALSWSSADATSCSASDDWSGTRTADGASSVHPTAVASYTYTLTCSGSGGTAGASATLAVSAPLNSETSYENFKAVGLVPQQLPVGVSGNTSRAYADFSGNGRLDLFTATLTYSPSNPVSQATASRFEFFVKQADGSFVKDVALLPASDGCVHPRKAIVADFNGDGHADVFVACTGYDAEPFPGERNRVVLSQPGGTYLTQDASSDVSFFHGAAAADMDGDGDIDVVAINHPTSPAILLVNDGIGTFVRDVPFNLPSSLASQASYFTVELVDLDADMHVDMLLGGHEFEGANTVLLTNPGTNDFSTVTPQMLPPVPNEGVVLDFTATGTGVNQVLWALRTSGGDGTFYESRTIQKVALSTMSSSVVFSERPAQWIPWIIAAVVNGQPVIASDDLSAGVSVSQ